MVRLREIPRTATFSWSTGSTTPLLVTGTRAGAVDADFSSESALELWDLSLDDKAQGVELQPISSLNTESRFHDIAWSQASESHEHGIIAGALENGSLELWDAAKFKSNAGTSHISSTSQHSAAIKALQFNPSRHELLATAGAKGELFVTDFKNLDNPLRLGSQRSDDFECLDWNKKVAHILVTGSSGGFATVWDLKSKKASLNLNNYGRKAVSSIAWDPEISTKLATAIPSDQEPLILMWDLRNPNQPERTLKGHEQGVLSLSWCTKDSDLLLSCGKDNKTICWNSRTAQVLGEFPIVTNWTFETRWNPHNPALLATASFDGKIAIHTIQNSNASATAAAQTNQNLDGEDFFASASSKPQGAAFNLPKAPKWLERPTGVQFAFGGKVVRFGPSNENPRKSRVSISRFAVDSDIGTATEKFEKAITEGKLDEICQQKIASATSEDDRADWRVIAALSSDEYRIKFKEFLGFEDISLTTTTEVEEKSDKATAQASGSAKPGDDDDSSFFGGLSNGDDSLAALAANKTSAINKPFSIYTGSESTADREITQALIMGKFEKALDICLKEGRMSDAFMVALSGDEKCVEKARAAYYSKNADGPNYLRLLASISSGNLRDIVVNSDLKDWKETMAMICTLASQTQFAELCESLGERLETAAKSSDKPSRTLRRDAAFCYVAGCRLERVLNIWVQELEETESASIKAAEDGTSFSIHAKSLQDFIEKVTVFRQVIPSKFGDRQVSDSELAPLYAKYTEYADIVASHGQLDVAQKYLSLLPDSASNATIAKERIAQATKKTTAQAPTVNSRTTSRVPPMPSTAATTFIPAATATTQSTSGYMPPGANPPVQPVGQPFANTNRSYAPPGPGYQPPSQQNAYGYGGYGQPQPAAQPVPPPPRNFQSSSPAPPPKSKATGSWNDVPEVTKPISRRGTPGLQPQTISSPFPNAQPAVSPPMGSSFGQQPPPPGNVVPPPPKANDMPPRMRSPPQTSHTPINRPSSRVTNTYAPAPGPQMPPPSTHQGFAPPAPPPIARGNSPYNPPPSTSASTQPNRYAPASGAPASSAPQPPPMGSMQNRPPPPNPYAPSQPQPGAQSGPYAPSPMGSSPYAPQAGGAYANPGNAPPPSGPPRAGPPPGGPPPGGPTQSTGPPRAGPPPGGPPRSGPPQGGPRQPPPQNQPPSSSTFESHEQAPAPAALHNTVANLRQGMDYVKTYAPPERLENVTKIEQELEKVLHQLQGNQLPARAVPQLDDFSQMLVAHNYDPAEKKLREMKEVPTADRTILLRLLKTHRAAHSEALQREGAAGRDD